MSRFSGLRLLAVALLTMQAAAFAATENADLYGTVYDRTGAPLPAITVLLSNPALGVARVNISGPDGTYTIREIPPGDGYILTAKRAGEVMDVVTSIEVNVGDERVILPPLREHPPAAATPSVKTEARTVHNELVSTAVSGVITGTQLRSLPFYNRTFLDLGLLVPNTHEVEAGSTLAGATFSIAGARPTNNNFLLDGSDNVASSSNQAIPFQVNDSIQEFRVTSNAGAEFGRNLGGS